jgi:hypothetical protein
MQTSSSMINRPDDEARRRADARNAVFSYLYDRPGLALSLDAISNGIRQSGQTQFSPTDLYIGAHFLVDRKFAEIKKTSISATERFQITSAGQLEFENMI